jgi:exodeoxyribonuclease-3
MRLLSYNIRYGGTGRAAQLAAVIRAAAPDVVMLQEAVDPDTVARLAVATEMPHWGSHAGRSTGFLSRIPVGYYAWHRPRIAHHAFLELTIGDGSVRVFGLHLKAWFSNWTERRRRMEIAALLAGIREHQDGFHLLAGDFNALAPGELLRAERFPGWIRAMIWLSGRDIARHTIQAMLDAQYTDAWRLLHPDEDGHTFPTWDPHLRLDYIFTPSRYADRVTHCEVVRSVQEAPTASDHFPIMVEVT